MSPRHRTSPAVSRALARRCYNADMEPALVTEPRLRAVLAELVDQEPLFHRFKLGTERVDVEAMLASDFWEIGASGRHYGRRDVLEVLEQRLRHPVQEKWNVTEPHCRELTPDLYLLTYTLFLAGRTTRRATIWRRAAVGWLVIFHQGTVVTA